MEWPSTNGSSSVTHRSSTGMHSSSTSRKYWTGIYRNLHFHACSSKKRAFANSFFENDGWRMVMHRSSTGPHRWTGTNIYTCMYCRFCNIQSSDRPCFICWTTHTQTIFVIVIYTLHCHHFCELSKHHTNITNINFVLKYLTRTSSPTHQNLSKLINMNTTKFRQTD